MRAVFSLVDRVVEALVVIIFAVIVVVGLAQVSNRYFLNMSLSWSEELQRYGQIWLVFLAVPAAYRRTLHMGIEGLRGRLGSRHRKLLERAIDALWVALGGAIAYGTVLLMGVLKSQRSAGLGLPMHWVYAGVLLGALYMVFVGIRRLLGEDTAAGARRSDEVAGM